jgi:hypothetical protein
MILHIARRVAETLTPYVPLMQTVAWFLFIATLLRWYRKPIDRVLEVLLSRLEGGSEFKMAGFEVGPPFVPQTLAERDRRNESAVLEFQEDVANDAVRRDGALATTKTRVIGPRDAIAQRFRLIEDAALSRTAFELGLPITRDVKPFRRSNLLFDGVAADAAAYRIVEVRVAASSQAITSARRFLDSVASFVDGLGKEQRDLVSVVLAVVIAKEFQGDPSGVTKAIEQIALEYKFPVQVMQFSEERLIDGHKA